MKNRNLFLAIVLTAILLLGTVLVASAADKILLTGGINNTYFGFGWEWMNFNVSIDPAAPPTDNTDGKVHYRVYIDDGSPKEWENWIGEPICGAFGYLNDVPTIALVVKILEVKNIDPAWEGKYLKVTLSDGGQNASEDMVGIVEFDLINAQPVPDQPSCDFVEPEDILVQYPSQNGNLTIHE